MINLWNMRLNDKKKLNQSNSVKFKIYICVWTYVDQCGIIDRTSLELEKVETFKCLQVLLESQLSWAHSF